MRCHISPRSTPAADFLFVGVELSVKVCEGKRKFTVESDDINLEPNRSLTLSVLYASMS